MSSLQEIQARVRLEGPIDVFIAPSEFDLLKGHMRRLWNVVPHWSESDRLTVLAYFRAYTFYRELSTNEREFWSSFHQGLELDDERMTDAKYDELEKALTSDRRITPLFVQRSRREFVQTIDAIWGVSGLNAARLTALFRRYYFTTPGMEVTQALLRKLDPEIDEVTLRQARLYDRVFRCMTDAVHLILEHALPVDPPDPDGLTGRLRSLGLSLINPNPIKFFHLKSQRAIPDLIRDLRGSVKPRQKTRTAPGAGIGVTLADGYYQIGEAVELDFYDLPPGPYTLVHTSPSATIKHHLTCPHVSLGARDVSESGCHAFQVFVGDGPVTGKTPFWALPELSWEPNTNSDLLVEGAIIAGEVSVTGEDERFATFRWQPGWNGDTPKPYKVYAVLDKYERLEVEAWLEAESVAVQAVEVDTGELLVLPTDLDRLRLRQLQANKRKLSAYLRSDLGRRVSITDDDSIALAQLTARRRDTLVVEAQHRGMSVFVNAFAIRGSPLSASLRSLISGGIGYSHLSS